MHGCRILAYFLQIRDGEVFGVESVLNEDGQEMIAIHNQMGFNKEKLDAVFRTSPYGFILPNHYYAKQFEAELQNRRIRFERVGYENRFYTLDELVG